MCEEVGALRTEGPGGECAGCWRRALHRRWWRMMVWRGVGAHPKVVVRLEGAELASHAAQVDGRAPKLALLDRRVVLFEKPRSVGEPSKLRELGTRAVKLPPQLRNAQNRALQPLAQCTVR